MAGNYYSLYQNVQYTVYVLSTFPELKLIQVYNLCFKTIFCNIIPFSGSIKLALPLKLVLRFTVLFFSLLLDPCRSLIHEVEGELVLVLPLGQKCLVVVQLLLLLILYTEFILFFPLCFCLLFCYPYLYTERKSLLYMSCYQ